jgi:hypothetical protein
MHFTASFYSVVICDIALMALVVWISNRLPRAEGAGSKIAAVLAAFVGFSAGMIVGGGLAGLLLKRAAVDVSSLVNAWDDHREGLAALLAPPSVFLLVLAISVISAQLAWGATTRVARRRGRRRPPVQA